jgi:hypothetical protein
MKPEALCGIGSPTNGSSPIQEDAALNVFCGKDDTGKVEINQCFVQISHRLTGNTVRLRQMTSRKPSFEL